MKTKIVLIIAVILISMFITMVVGEENNKSEAVTISGDSEASISITSLDDSSAIKIPEIAF